MPKKLKKGLLVEEDGRGPGLRVKCLSSTKSTQGLLRIAIGESENNPEKEKTKH